MLEMEIKYIGWITVDQMKYSKKLWKKKNDEDENEIKVKGSKGKWLSWKAGKMAPSRYRVIEEVKLNKGRERLAAEEAFEFGVYRVPSRRVNSLLNIHMNTPPTPPLLIGILQNLKSLQYITHNVQHII